MGSRIIESAAYCNHISRAQVYINRAQNTLVNWIIRLLLSLLCRPKVILLSGGHCTWQVASFDINYTSQGITVKFRNWIKIFFYRVGSRKEQVNKVFFFSFRPQFLGESMEQTTDIFETFFQKFQKNKFSISFLKWRRQKKFISEFENKKCNFEVFLPFFLNFE